MTVAPRSCVELLLRSGQEIIIQANQKCFVASLIFSPPSRPGPTPRE